MAHSLPGTPPIVLRARAVLARRARIGFVTLVASVVLCAGAGGLCAFWAGPEAIILATVLGFAPVWGVLFGLSAAPSESAAADARAIDQAWKEERAAWAKAVVTASVIGSEADVGAWSSADRALAEMAASAKTRGVQAE